MHTQIHIFFLNKITHQTRPIKPYWFLLKSVFKCSTKHYLKYSNIIFFMNNIVFWNIFHRSIKSDTSSINGHPLRQTIYSCKALITIMSWNQIKIVLTNNSNEFFLNDFRLKNEIFGVNVFFTQAAFLGRWTVRVEQSKTTANKNFIKIL